MFRVYPSSTAVESRAAVFGSAGHSDQEHGMKGRVGERSQLCLATASEPNNRSGLSTRLSRANLCCAGMR